jgi:CRP-like cAMP-binding protein
VRLCALNPTSTADDVAAVVRHFADAPDVTGPAAAVPGAQVAPVLAALSAAGRAQVDRWGRIVQARRGEVVVRQWAADRSFYVILSGRYEAEVDGVQVRTMRDGFFGELAAGDWGAGYGYPRLATVRCVDPGQLLAVPAVVFQSLLETEPGLRAAVDAAVAERLPRS